MHPIEIYEKTENKTRVLIISQNSKILHFFLKILYFHQIEIDFFTKESSKISGEDFFLFATDDLQRAPDFFPNLLFLTEEYPTKDYKKLLQNVVSGGVVIYPESLENQINSVENYFRKISYSQINYTKNDAFFLLETEMGKIPFPCQQQLLLPNLEGIKLLCQQLGIMEEDFYEAVMAY